ncbi:MAG TPA: hypothetical protein VFZ59_15005 [Verrucomicrobiae bacterium]|nr:hypothetical protein [Verrucomicrobiae bacterium]
METILFAQIGDSSSNLFWNAVGSAVGGFLGVIVFFIVRRCYHHKMTTPELVRTYLCASKVNTGQEKESRGELQHHSGRAITDSREYEKLNAGRAIWQWSRDKSGDKKGNSVFYGPYSTDMIPPGLYSITFRILGKGFPKEEDLRKDVNILEIDAVCGLPHIVTTNQGIGILETQPKMARRFIRVSELAKEGWQDYELRVWSDGRGVWEYRAFAFDGAGGEDNLKDFGSNAEIYFESVTIYRLPPRQLIPD